MRIGSRFSLTMRSNAGKRQGREEEKAKKEGKEAEVPNDELRKKEEEARSGFFRMVSRLVSGPPEHEADEQNREYECRNARIHHVALLQEDQNGHGDAEDRS